MIVLKIGSIFVPFFSVVEVAKNRHFLCAIFERLANEQAVECMAPQHDLLTEFQHYSHTLFFALPPWLVVIALIECE